MNSRSRERRSKTGFLVSVTGLARDKGWIGQALSSFPAWLLKEADRSADCNFTWLRKHNDPKRLPLPDPWQFLLDAPVTPVLLKKVCRAAQSQIVAWQGLCRRATGVSSSDTDWQQEAMKARAKGQNRRSDRAAIKVFGALWRFHPAQGMAQEYVELNLARLAHAQAWQERRRAQLVHRGDRSGADEIKPLPRWKEIQTSFPLETQLVFGWVRLRPHGPPGFMFWRNEALRKLILLLRRGAQVALRNLGRDYIKNLRQNLGLIPVNDAACMIWDVTVDSRSEGGWLVKGRERNGKLIFEEVFSAGASG